MPKHRDDCTKDPREIAEDDRDYYLERIYPSFGNLVPRDIASRQAKNVCDEGRGVGPMVGDFRRGVYLDFTDAIARLGRAAVEAKYGNLFDMYARITGENPYEVPMRIYPAVHYVMGGLWVDYDLQSSIPGLFVTGEANFSDHGANRLGASALMQGLADGYFVLPNTIRDYLAKGPFEQLPEDTAEVVAARTAVEERTARLLAVNGERSVDSFHKELGNVMWEYCGMERSEEGLLKAIDLIRGLRDEFWRNVRILGAADTLNQSLEKAGRVADFLELGELMCIDALHRRESCGGHFRLESQTEDGEALRDDDGFLYVAAWEFAGGDGDGEMSTPVLHKEDLVYEAIELKQRATSDHPTTFYAPPQSVDPTPIRREDPDHEPHPEDLAAGRTRHKGELDLQGQGHQPRHELPRDARRPQRAAQHQGRGADRVRLRLSRGHLRHVRPDDLRRGPRSREDDDLPAAHAQLQRRRGHHHRAVAGQRLPGDQGPRRRPRLVRPIIQAGGYISVNTGSAPDADATPVPKPDADRAFAAAECIGCGACVAACPNASAMLFMGAKVTHLSELPQGQPERMARVVSMVDQHDHEGFGGCTNVGACSQACPKGIPQDVISTSTRTSAARCAPPAEPAPPGQGRCRPRAPSAAARAGRGAAWAAAVASASPCRRHGCRHAGRWPRPR